MFGRIDDTKYQAGLATCRNFIALPQGPAENRTGTVYIRVTKDSTKESRLIPFTYSTTQTMVLEFGEYYIRFYTQGAWLTYAVPAAYNAAVTYNVGDLCAQGGTNYYCIATTTGAFDAADWYALPADLTYEIPTPYAEADLFELHYVQSADVLTITHNNYPPSELRRNGATDWTLTVIDWTPSIGTPAAPVCVKAGAGVGYTYMYVVTAIAADSITEGLASAFGGVADSNLYTSGTYHTISWGAVAGAVRYNVYRYTGGVWAFIGSTGSLSIVDDNISPDTSVCPPIYPTPFTGAGNYPAAVSYYEQRRAFAGTINAPQSMWMTKSGTESNMSYSLPIKDDDRISVRVAAREANAIRHIVPLSQLLLLTSAAEWRVTSINSDAITPSSISVKPQSYVGASNTQPCIVNTNLIYIAARGGHVRECGYNWQANGFITGDLSLRSAHLFDHYDITDMAYSKAPQPILWFISTSGKLLGLTYVPEQQIGAWHQHDTVNGIFESCCCVAEGAEDALYVVVKRYINGAYVRYIERFATRRFDDLEDAFFVDCGLTYDGTNVAATTMTLTGGVLWGPTESLTLTASVNSFVAGDIGDVIVLTGIDNKTYRMRITAVTAPTVAKVTPELTVTIASGLRAAATASWAWARLVMSGLGHLEGETVNILADGSVHAPKVVTAGEITLDSPAALVHVGLPITADLETLPITLQADGFGQGRTKNVNKCWLRVYRSGGIWVGPDEDNLTEMKQRIGELFGDPPELKTEEMQIVVTPLWGSGGQVFVRQTDPLPLKLVSLTSEVAVGG
jgi:hypothetical protein